MGMESKKIAGERAVDYVRDGMIVGLGTGSTVYWTLSRLGEKIKQGLSVQAVATSVQTESLAKEFGIALIPFSKVESIDLTIDGADEVDPEWNLVKGGGGALLREKIVADASKRLIIVADESKLVRHLGKFPLPVEVVKFGFEWTMRRLSGLGCSVKPRLSGDNPFVTDNGNFIVDCSFESIVRPRELHREINDIPGVIDNGLFIDRASRVIVGCQDGTVKELNSGEAM
jgi:ribose 5-phosphate isomerase A